tara:strand:- start:21 stop:140 length:120 start_codon:yes stop_codon:yes gene_type:complete
MTSTVGVERRTSLGELNCADGANLLFSEFEPCSKKSEEE